MWRSWEYFDAQVSQKASDKKLLPLAVNLQEDSIYMNCHRDVVPFEAFRNLLFRIYIPLDSLYHSKTSFLECDLCILKPYLTLLNHVQTFSLISSHKNVYYYFYHHLYIPKCFQIFFQQLDVWPLCRVSVFRMSYHTDKAYGVQILEDTLYILVDNEVLG